MKNHKKKWLVPALVAVAVILVVAGYFAYYSYALKQLRITDMAVSEFTEFSLAGFSFIGYFDVYNPGMISVNIDRIDYSVYFEPTQDLLASGYLEGEKLPAKQVTRIPFHQRVSWAPAVSLILQMAASKEPANIVLSGNVHITENILLPFMYKYDIKALFKQYAEQYIESQKQGAVDKIEEKYGKTAGIVAEHIAGYLPEIAQFI